MHNNVDAAVSPPTKSSSVESTSKSKAAKFQEADLLPFDVLCGRGSNINDYEGNQHFREIILSRRDEYTGLSNKDWNGKNKIAAEIVAAIRAKGGRFLKRVDGYKKKHPVYEYAEEEMIFEKTKQALRQKSRKKIKLTLPKPPTFGLGSSKPEAKDKTRPPCPPTSAPKPETAAVKKSSHAQSTRRPVVNMEFLEFIQNQVGSASGDSRSDPSLPGPLHQPREAFQSKSYGGLPRHPADFPQFLTDADHLYQPHPPVLQQPVVNVGQFMDYSHYVAAANSGNHNCQPPNYRAMNVGELGISSQLGQPTFQQRLAASMEFANNSRPIQLESQPTLQCQQRVESMGINAHDIINVKARAVENMEVVNNESQDPDSKDDKLLLSENSPIEDCARLLQHLKKPHSIGGSAGGLSLGSFPAESADAQTLTDTANKSKDDSFALRLEKMSLPTAREDLMSLMSNELMSAATSTARSKNTCENSFEEKLEGMSILSMSSGGSRETGARPNELRTFSGDANSGPIHMDTGNAANPTPTSLRRSYNQHRLSHINEHDAQMHMNSYALPAWSGAEYGHMLPSTRIAMPSFPHQVTHPPLGVPDPSPMEAGTSFEQRGKRKSLSSYYRETARGVPPQRHFSNC
ncbi:hypothetical protein THAOC_30804 [Thalassiosira oceanica]|uniref:DUF6824 domain-containing protein n=1 Tax=Thalassiosira oceanica TaxID=159749 RepID=K0RUE4_THAOC|nr:hypothetical protein THAOC_30804 [Thalassiosira oceanica]|eukprot:EJK50252.1 hypothetical protein THAOC_30804 [Thalassiosira oceanica]